jgi:hypothetical protein
MRSLVATVYFVLNVCILFSLHASEIPRVINHQGLITDAEGTPVSDGIYALTLRIYDEESDGTQLWIETQAVQVKRGIYSVRIGSVIPLNLDFDAEYWLGITVNDGEELEPRIPFSSVPYAIIAQTVPDNSISSEKLADNAVTGTKIEPESITDDHIADRIRKISLPAGALNINDSSNIISMSLGGLLWKRSFSAAALLMRERPDDWDGESDVTFSIFFRTTSSVSGNVDFFIRPRAYDIGDIFGDATSMSTSPVAVSANNVIAKQDFIIPASVFGDKMFWVINIQNQGSGSTYPDDVIVWAVSLTYNAVR